MECKSSASKKLWILWTITSISLFIGAAITFSALAVTSPGASSPVMAHHDDYLGIPEDYVTAVLARVFHDRKEGPLATPSNSTHHHQQPLEKRAPPLNHGCRHHSTWRARECLADGAPTAWADRCTFHEPGQPDQYYDVRGYCDPGFVCAEYFDADNHKHIECRMKNPAQQDNVERDAKRRRITQYGNREIPAATDLGGVQLVRSIGVQGAMGGASASGFLTDSQKSYLIAPRRRLVCHLRNKEDPLCQSGVGGKDRECYPLITNDLKAGDVMDYTFSVSYGQAVVLFYALSGSIV